MASTRVIVGTVVTAAVLALGVACSSSSSGDGSSGSSGTNTSGGTGTSGGGGTSGSGTSGSGFKNCSGTTTSNQCTDAELKPYVDCVNEKCATKYAECYGADYRTGNFGGPCGTFISCTNACGCNDTACQQKCGSPSPACTTCIQGSATCSDSCTATAPACLKSGGSSGSSGASGGGGGNKTCADLKACCDKITDTAKKGNCDQTYNLSKDSDPTCNALYSTFAADCP